MLKNLIANLKELDKKTITIRAEGNYPRGTPVQHVAHYQNDGTPTIKPARFVEAAERANQGWKQVIISYVEKYLDGDMGAIEQLGLRISYDINEAVNRIKTGRLKKSMRPEIK